MRGFFIIVTNELDSVRFSTHHSAVIARLYFRHCVVMYSCSVLNAAWSLSIPDRILRTFRPATSESSTVSSLPMQEVLAVLVEAGTGHLTLTSTRPPLSSPPEDELFNGYLLGQDLSTLSPAKIALMLPRSRYVSATSRGTISYSIKAVIPRTYISLTLQ